MKKILVLVVAASLAACSGADKPMEQGTAQPADAAAASQPEAKASATPEPAAKQSLYARLPDQSIRFNFDFAFKADKTVEKNGAKRRGVAIEYSSIDGPDLWRELDAGFANVGYSTATSAPVSGDGVGSRRYSRTGSPTITASIGERSDEQRAAGKGVIWFGWGL
jgi:hypothetical protein